LTVQEVLQLGHPTLREKSNTVEDFSQLGPLMNDLGDTLAHWKKTTGYGRGIAAPQIGVLKRVVFINIDQPWLLVNPEIAWMSPEKMVVWDSCLSYLSIFFQVSRAKKIRIRYRNIDQELKEIDVEDSLSELLQHEIDHLDGILAIDRVLDIRKILTREEYEKRFAPRKA